METQVSHRDFNPERPDQVFAAGDWEPLIIYKTKGSKSEGQHALLMHSGHAVPGRKLGQRLRSDLCELRYCGIPRSPPRRGSTGAGTSPTRGASSLLGKRTAADDGTGGGSMQPVSGRAVKDGERGAHP